MSGQCACRAIRPHTSGSETKAARASFTFVRGVDPPCITGSRTSPIMWPCQSVHSWNQDFRRLRSPCTRRECTPGSAFPQASSTWPSESKSPCAPALTATGQRPTLKPNARPFRAPYLRRCAIGPTRSHGDRYGSRRLHSATGDAARRLGARQSGGILRADGVQFGTRKELVQFVAPRSSRNFRRHMDARRLRPSNHGPGRQLLVVRVCREHELPKSARVAGAESTGREVQARQRMSGRPAARFARFRRPLMAIVECHIQTRSET